VEHRRSRRAALGLAWRRERPGEATLIGAIVLAAIASNEAIALYGPAKMRRVRPAA